MSSLLPVGRYWGRVVSQSLGQGKTGTTTFALRLELMGRVVTAQGGGEELEDVGSGVERTVYVYITDKTIGFVAEKLAAIGYRKQSIKLLNPDVDGFHDFTGQEVELYCNHDSYEGKEREKWDINTRRDSKLEPADPKALRGLDVLFGKAMKSQPATTKPTTAAKQPTPTPEPPTDDPNGTLQEAAVDEGDEVPF